MEATLFKRLQFEVILLDLLYEALRGRHCVIGRSYSQTSCWGFVMILVRKEREKPGQNIAGAKHKKQIYLIAKLLTILTSRFAHEGRLYY